MVLTLRLTDEEQAALRAVAESEGVSLDEVVRRAVQAYVAQAQHRDRLMAAAQRVRSAHNDALERLGE